MTEEKGNIFTLLEWAQSPAVEYRITEEQADEVREMQRKFADLCHRLNIPALSVACIAVTGNDYTVLGESNFPFKGDVGRNIPEIIMMHHLITCGFNVANELAKDVTDAADYRYRTVIQNQPTKH